MYHHKGKSIFVSMPKSLAWTQQHDGLNVTITSEVVVYASAERAKKLLYPFLLCGDDCRKGSGMPILYSLYSLPIAGISGLRNELMPISEYYPPTVGEIMEQA
jgi:hypothetical protein